MKKFFIVGLLLVFPLISSGRALMQQVISSPVEIIINCPQILVPLVASEPGWDGVPSNASSNYRLINVEVEGGQLRCDYSLLQSEGLDAASIGVGIIVTKSVPPGTTCTVDVNPATETGPVDSSRGNFKCTY